MYVKIRMYKTQDDRSRWRIAAIPALALAGLAAGQPAHADEWEPLSTSRPGYRQPSMERYQRSSDQAPASPSPSSPSVHFPGLPPPPQLNFGRTKNGPLTFDGLRLEPDGRGGFHGRRPGYRFEIPPDGSIKFFDRPAIQVEAFYLLGLAGTFDLADWLMRLHGDDPYWYDKNQIRILTGPMREKLASANRIDRVRVAEAELPTHLRRLWEDRTLSVKTRRELLFSLWDELLDAPDVGGPEAAAAARARATIVEFIRTRLPAGRADSFSAVELTALNAGRRSQVPFAPYGAAPTSPP